MRRIAKWVIIAAVLLLSLIAGNFVYGWTAPGPLAREASVVIKAGSSITSAAVQLEAEGVVKSADAFVNRAKVFGATSTIKAGEFVIPAGASNSDVLDILTGGKTVQRMVTIPEGWPSIMVYERLMANDRLEGSIGVPVEGSVLPDSYAFEKKESRADVLKRMQDADLPLVTRERDIGELQSMFETLSFNKARILLTYWDWAQGKTGPYATVQ